jgi:glycosyltransferase involved in cell wall biosynthesis
LIFVVAIGKKPIVLSPRGELFDAASKRKTFKKKLVFGLYLILKRRLLFHATAESEERLIRQYFGDVKVEVQPNFLLPKYSDKKVLCKRDFLFLGRINPIKNIHILIEAASISARFMSSNARIVVAGEARLDYEITYLTELNALILRLEMQDKVQFLGHVEHDSKEKLLNHAYFLVLPSKSENFGNVVPEALMQGTPVIASTGTPWQSLRDNNAGYWVENNILSFAAAIDKSLELKETDYIAYSQNAQKLVRSCFDTESPANRWQEIYKHISEKLK